MTDTGKDFRVAVVGGGMCGLLCGLGLMKAGVHVEIFEQAPSFGEVGAGLALAQNALFALKEMGVLEAVLSKSEVDEPALQAFQFISAFGTHDLIYDYPLTPGDATLMVYRNVLPSFLEAIVPFIDPRLVHMEKRCISVSSLSSGSHVLRFDDESTYEADLIVGADGIRSVLREFVTGEPTSLAYSNTVAYRAVIPSEAFKAVKKDITRPLCWIGQDQHFITYPMQANKKMNFVFFSTDTTVPKGSVNIPHPWAKPTSRDEFLHEFSRAEWGEDANIIIKEMKNLSKWYLHYTQPPLSSYSRERVVLVGDAAHAMLPYLGSGAGQGFEDVYALCHFLGDARARKSHLDDVLKTYDSIRVARANMIVERSTLMGEIVDMRGPGGKTIPQIQEQLIDIYHPIWHYDLKEEVMRAVASVYGQGGAL